MQGSGNVITEKRDVSGYHAVALSGIGDLDIDQNGAEGLTIEGEDNILPHIVSEVRDGTLHIGPEPVHEALHPTRPIKYSLSARSLDGIKVSGAGHAKASRLESASFSLVLSGAGGLQIDSLATGDLSVNVSGSGNVALAGRAASQKIDISGAGQFEAPNLASSTANVRISGAGSAIVRVSERLDAHISGAGSVAYIGNPTVSHHLSGVGSVRKLPDG